MLIFLIYKIIIHERKNMNIKAFLVKDGMKCKRFDEEYEVSITGNLLYEHCYCVNNNVVAYVHEQQLYVFPFDKDSLNELILDDFKSISMFVPFSNHDEPLINVKEYNYVFNK